MKTKYTFIAQPPPGVFGEWKMADGFKCYTDSRARAVSWYKRWLEKKGKKYKK